MPTKPRETLLEMMLSAGIKSQAELARKAGLKPYEISRILSQNSTRRPTPLQLRRLSEALGQTSDAIEEAIGIVDGSHESLDDLRVSVRRLTGESAELRCDLTEKEAKIEAAERTIKELAARANNLQIERDQLKEDLELLSQHRVHLDGRIREVQEERSKIENALLEANQRFFEIEALVNQIRAQAAEDMARLFAELQALRQHLGAGKLAAIKQAILEGPFGAALRSIIDGGDGEKITSRWAQQARSVQTEVALKTDEPIRPIEGTTKKRQR